MTSGPDADAQISWNLPFQARAIAADLTSTATSRWLVGTNALREANEVQVLEYDEDADALRCAATYAHAAELWALAPHPSDPRLLLTVGNAGGLYSVTLWRRPGMDGAGEDGDRDGHGDGDERRGPGELGGGVGVGGGGAGAPVLEEVCQLRGHAPGPVHAAQWHPGSPGQAATLDGERVRLWAMREGGAQCTAEARASDLQQPWAAAWDPHTPSRLATTAGADVQLWDSRATQGSAAPSSSTPGHGAAAAALARVGEVEGAGHAPLRCVDWAPRSEHVLLTAGDDCALRLWDLRMVAGGGGGGSGGTAAPLLELGGGHRHWVWGARFNPQHEQLIASASSDASAALWYVPCLLPADGGGAPGDGGGRRKAGQPALSCSRVESYEGYEDSVYGVAWSAADPWLFAALSYDGRMTVNRVPSQTKYKIIL